MKKLIDIINEVRRYENTKVNSDDAFDELEKAGVSPLTSSDGINYTHKGKHYTLKHEMGTGGHRYVEQEALNFHLANIKRDK